MRTETHWSDIGRRIVLGLAVFSMVLAPVAASVVRAAFDEDIPFDLRQDLERALKAKIDKLLEDKNADGVPYKRGAYSKSFHKVDDSTYQVTFHQDTVEDGKLTTQRYLLTLKKTGPEKWEIADEELKDTYEGLCRTMPGDEDFYRFDRFQFDREGFSVSGSNGSLVKDYLNGKVNGFAIHADDLSYEYSPPADVGYHQLHRLNVRDWSEDLAFTPELAVVYCDPVTCEEMLDSLFEGIRPSSKQEISGVLRNEYEEDQKDQKEVRRDNPFSGFRRPFEEERRTYTILVKKKGLRDHYNWMDYDNYGPREVHFGSSKFGWLYGYHSKETREAGIDPYELELRPDFDARDYELSSLEGTVELALEDSETLRGDVTYGLNLKRDRREIPFAISRMHNPGDDRKQTKDPKLFIDSVQDGEGNELTWVKQGGWGGMVVLPEEKPAGSKITLRLQFTNKDGIFKLNPSYSYVDREGWLPFVRYTDMIDNVKLTVKVPDKYTTLGIGKKLSESRNDGVNITEWASEKPVNFPTVIFGEYIEDEPSFKATKLDGTEIPVKIFVDRVSTHTVDSYAAASGGASGIRGKQLRALSEQAANALNLYRAIYEVDYPYHKLDLVNAPFQPGAQAPSSIIYVGSFLFRGEGEMGTLGGEEISKFLKDTVAHETGHQWWGGLICNANNRNYWFIESLAEYSSALYVENLNAARSLEKGRAAYLEKVADWRDNLLKLDVRASVKDARVLWQGEFPYDSYIALVYNKGPYAFHILRETFGDEKFFTFLKTMAKDLSGKEIVTRDIQKTAEKVYGVRMGWFFDQWIRGVGVPEYSFNYTTRQTEDGNWLVQGVVKQRVVVGSKQHKEVLDGVYYLGAVPITVTARKSKEEYKVPIRVEGPESQFAFKVPEEPLEVAFNKYGEILAHDVLVNQGW